MLALANSTLARSGLDISLSVERRRAIVVIDRAQERAVRINTGDIRHVLVMTIDIIGAS